MSKFERSTFFSSTLATRRSIRKARATTFGISEFAREPANTWEFERILDEELSTNCESYRRVRALHGLGAPPVVVVPSAESARTPTFRTNP